MLMRISIKLKNCLSVHLIPFEFTHFLTSYCTYRSSFYTKLSDEYKFWNEVSTFVFFIYSAMIVEQNSLEIFVQTAWQTTNKQLSCSTHTRNVFTFKGCQWVECMFCSQRYWVQFSELAKKNSDFAIFCLNNLFCLHLFFVLCYFRRQHFKLLCMLFYFLVLYLCSTKTILKLQEQFNIVAGCRDYL